MAVDEVDDWVVVGGGAKVGVGMVGVETEADADGVTAACGVEVVVAAAGVWEVGAAAGVIADGL